MSWLEGCPREVFFYLPNLLDTAVAVSGRQPISRETTVARPRTSGCEHPACSTSQRRSASAVDGSLLAQRLRHGHSLDGSYGASSFLWTLADPSD